MRPNERRTLVQRLGSPLTGMAPVPDEMRASRNILKPVGLLIEETTTSTSGGGVVFLEEEAAVLRAMERKCEGK
jgi:hypothetical protein